MVMDNSKNLCVFNFAILLKSWKLDAREIYVFYSITFLAALVDLFVTLGFEIRSSQKTNKQVYLQHI